MATSFVVKSVNSACRTALLKHAQLQISRCSAQAFRLGRTGIYTQQWSWVRKYLPCLDGAVEPSVARIALWGLDSSWPTPLVPWPNSATYFALWVISSICSTLLEHCWDMQFPGVVASLSVQTGPGATLSSGPGYDQLPCLAESWPGSSIDKALHLKQTCTLPISLVRVCHWLDSADEWSHWLGLLFECYR